jgi:hypothetical protein
LSGHGPCVKTNKTGSTTVNITTVNIMSFSVFIALETGKMGNICVFNRFSLDQIKDQYKFMPDMLIQITGDTSIFSQSVPAHVHLETLKCLKPSCLSII